MAKLVNKFDIGCDPEFVVLGANGSILNVDDVVTHHGPIGYDHGGYVAEAHPPQCRGTWSLTKRIQAILRGAPKKLLDSPKWRAGAVYSSEGVGRTSVTLGGHIHFDVNPRRGTNAFANLTDKLDGVTRLLEHLDVLPTAESNARRHNGGGYGRFGDVRTDNGHFEYRVMASWLYDPWVTFLTLTTAKLVAATHADDEVPLMSAANGMKGFLAFLARFKGKDINADRLLEKLERDKTWLKAQPDADVKQAWAVRL